MRSTFRRVGIAACLLAAACGGRYVQVENGGVDLPRTASCTDVAISAQLQPVATDAPDCAARATVLVPEGAAAAFWKRGTDPAWLGPAVAPPATIDVEYREPLETGSSKRGLESGSGEKGLESGAAQRGLESGAGQKGLESGAGQKGLESGAAQKGLESGSGQRGLEAAAAQKGLETGAGQRGLETGSAQVDKPPLEVKKVANGKAMRDDPGEFVITVTNKSEDTLSGVAVVDRVSHLLRVTVNATTVDLKDQSTLVLFESAGPMKPGETRTLSMHVFAR